MLIRGSVARLMAKPGGGRLTDLRSFLTANCPKRKRRSIHAQCEALFDPPPETRRERGRRGERAPNYSRCAVDNTVVCCLGAPRDWGSKALGDEFSLKMMQFGRTPKQLMSRLL